MKHGFRVIALGGLALAAMLAAPALAQDEPIDEVDRACVAACREAHRDCRFDSREASQECRDDAGCPALREAYREVCLTEDRDDEACAEARTAYRDCVEPCRDAHREAGSDCREAAASCLEDECGLDAPVRRRPGHGRRGGGRFGR